MPCAGGGASAGSRGEGSASVSGAKALAGESRGGASPSPCHGGRPSGTRSGGGVGAWSQAWREKKRRRRSAKAAGGSEDS
eukprot:9166581-Alexandrium_andersonii.AAC.1